MRAVWSPGKALRLRAFGQTGLHGAVEERWLVPAWTLGLEGPELCFRDSPLSKWDWLAPALVCDTSSHRTCSLSSRCARQELGDFSPLRVCPGWEEGEVINSLPCATAVLSFPSAIPNLACPGPHLAQAPRLSLNKNKTKVERSRA